MAKYATGKYSKAISDRSGMEYPYNEMVKEWNGSLVHYTEFEAKHPQIRRRRTTADAIALQNSRVMKFQQPAQKFNNDITVSDSGGTQVQVINLTLPGIFAFGVQTQQFTGNGITTSVSSMVPDDGSAQNRQRQLSATIGNITVSIT
jgi:hypothetical protein|tara:strand:+ start:1241 stop:1681 length:441 start_codon:yes stop_codon:yes gene_type:complete